MSRRMSCSMTVLAVRDRRKTVTRRHPDTWKNTKPGDHLTFIEKGMGLRKGEKQVVIGHGVVVSNEVEPIMAITPMEIRREGFDPYQWTPLEWATWWAGSHGHSIAIRPYSWTPHNPADLDDILCRRIEWRYLPEAGT